jgi:hypothetical protein
MENTFFCNLEYSYVVDPRTTRGITTYFDSNIGLWNDIVDSGCGRGLRVYTNLFPLRVIADKLNNSSANLETNYITIGEPNMNDQLIPISIVGTSDFITSSRSQLLLCYNQVGHKSISLSCQEFSKMGKTFLEKLMDICTQYQVEIMINNDVSFHSSSYKQGYSLHIFGNQDNITVVETCVRILIDNLIYGYCVESIEIDLSLVPILGGADLFNFSQIAKQHSSNIYVPDLLSNLYNNVVQGNNLNTKTSIWVTAKDIPEVLATKHIVSNLIAQRITPKTTNGKRSFVIREIDVLKVKLDLLTIYNQPQILSIMFNHGVFIKLPSLGEQNNLKIFVQGYSEESVNEAINELNILFIDYYTIHVNKKINLALQSKKFEQFYLLQMHQSKKTCIITANKYGIEINGSSQDIKQVLPSLANFKDISTSIKLRLELSNSQRDFISGKKNGKLIKILNQLNQLPTIKFKPYNDYNFFIDFEIFEGTDISYMMRGLDLMEMEMPAELQFNIPEVFHKSIIGNGGSIIQSIMKKYNVFIKFSSFTDNKKDVYSLKRTNNVLIKCPRKNSKNIQLVKYDIDQLVNQCCLAKNLPNYHTEYFKLYKSQYMLIVNHNRLKTVNELESEFNCFINFPSSVEKFGTDNILNIEITGTELKTKQCISKFKGILSQMYEFRLTYNPGKFDDNLKNSQEFRQRVVIPFKILLGIEITIEENVESCHQILLSHYDSDITKGINELTFYLREKGFLIVEKKPYEFDPVVNFKEQLHTQFEPNLTNEFPLQSITNKVDSRYKLQKTGIANFESPISVNTNQYTIPKGIW